MNIFTFIRKSFCIQFNNFVVSTPVPGYKFTNCFESKLQQLFWHVVLNFSLLVVIAVNLKFWNQYQNQNTITVHEILEQGTTLPYPAAYLCLGFPLNPNSLKKYRNNFLKPNFTMSHEEIDYNLQTMLRFQRSTLNVTYKLKELLDNNVDIDLLRDNLNNLYFKIDELLEDCHIQGIRLECKDIFTPITTLPGYCYVFNSIFTDTHFPDNPHEVMYRKISEFDENWTVRFKILNEKNTALMMYLKDPRSLISLTDYPTYVWRPRKNISEFGFTIEQHCAEENIKSFKFSQRKCLFSDETFPYDDLNNVFKTKFYNQDLCLNYCHALKFMELCNCVPKVTLTIFQKLTLKTDICDIKDLNCIEDNYLTVRKTECRECLSNCNHTKYVSKPEIKNPPRENDTNNENSMLNSSLKMDFIEFTFDLEYWPLLHYRLIIIFSTTEFILAMTSTASLFLGTSLITFLEAFFNLFIRYFCFYFVNWDYFLRTLKKREELQRMKPIPCINMSLKPAFKK